jgi:hypothetical protein
VDGLWLGGEAAGAGEWDSAGARDGGGDGATGSGEATGAAAAGAGEELVAAGAARDWPAPSRTVACEATGAGIGEALTRPCGTPARTDSAAGSRGAYDGCG